MSSTEHIDGENQSIETYLEVMTARQTAFAEWVNQHPVAVGIQADETDWDDAFEWWFQHIEISMTPSDTTFQSYLDSIA